jgi:hypothetical protein
MAEAGLREDLMPQITPQYMAIAIAAVYALIGFIPLARRALGRPLLWVCLIAGVIAGFFAREAVNLAAEALAPVSSLAAGPGSVVATLVIAATVGELLKVLGPLAAVMLASASPSEGLAYGAAAGAGFGFIVVQQGLSMALGLVGAPFITPASTVIAVAGWFFRVLPQIVTTAYVARAGVSGGLGLALLLAILVQVGLGLVDRLPLLAGVPTGLVITALISLGFYIYLWNVNSTQTTRGVPAPQT